ncbi:MULTISPECIES: hypothetical protein [unclassified Myroides]|uniref:hypothetical protein n=1 Tax=unclassified Myroides TaxID=2642485 RepID=UPI003D2F6418
METDIQKTVKELENNQKTKISFQGKEFFLCKKQNQVKILPNFHIGIKLITLVVSLLVSFFLISLLMTLLGYIIDEFDLFSGYNSDGTYTSVSGQGIVGVIAEKFWFVFLVLSVFGAYRLSKAFNLWLMKIVHKSEYLALRDALNNSVIQMPVQDDKETDSLSEIKELNLNDHTDYERLQEILNNAERKLNQYKDE